MNCGLQHYWEEPLLRGFGCVYIAGDTSVLRQPEPLVWSWLVDIVHGLNLHFEAPTDVLDCSGILGYVRQKSCDIPYHWAQHKWPWCKRRRCQDGFINETLYHVVANMPYFCSFLLSSSPPSSSTPKILGITWHILPEVPIMCEYVI